LMKTLKYGEILLKEYETMTDVLNNLPRFTEEVYNKKDYTLELATWPQRNLNLNF